MAKFRILVVDDEPDIRFVVRHLLTPAFETVEAENGLDALEKLERYEPDIVLLDVRMPVMDGFRCCEGIRRHPRYHDMPVAFLSGLGDRATYAEAYASGATFYLEKPIDTTQLIALIESHICKYKITPAPKTFTVGELEGIDRTPLRPAGEVRVFDWPHPAPAAAQQATETDLSAEDTRVDFLSGAPPEKTKIRKTYGRRGAPIAEAAPGEHKAATPDAPPLPTTSDTGKKAPSPPAEEAAQPVKRATPAPEPPRPHPPGAPPPPTAPVSGPAAPSSPAKPPAQPAPPAPTRSARPSSLPQAVKAPAHPPAASHKPAKALPRIMVVNPDPKGMVPFAEGIRGRGEFMPLEDPLEAIELIARFQPDIAVLPLRMKGWDGLEVHRMMRGNPRLAHIHVAFTVSTTDEPSRRMAAERASGYPLIVQPISVDKVSGLIDRVLGSPGFVVREKRAPYGEYVRDVLQKIEKRKETLRRAKEKEAHVRHLAGWAKMVGKEVASPSGRADEVAIRPARDYYLP